MCRDAGTARLYEAISCDAMRCGEVWLRRRYGGPQAIPDRYYPVPRLAEQIQRALHPLDSTLAADTLSDCVWCVCERD